MAAANRDPPLLRLVESGDAKGVHDALAALSADARKAFLAGTSASSGDGGRRCSKPLLHGAVEKDQRKMVKTLLSYGAHVNAKGGIHDSTPLHIAAGEGHLSVLEILLQKGGDLKARDNSGSTPLHCAARGGHVAVVEALVQRGSDISAVEGVYKRTALHLAASAGHPAVLEALARRGAAVDAVDEEGNTPLHRAAAKGNLLALCTLLVFGSSTKKRNKEGKTPMQLLTISLAKAKKLVAIENERIRLQREISIMDEELAKMEREKNRRCNAMEGEAADLQEEVRELKERAKKREEAFRSLEAKHGEEMQDMKGRFNARWDEEQKRMKENIASLKAKHGEEMQDMKGRFNARWDEEQNRKKEIVTSLQDKHKEQTQELQRKYSAKEAEAQNLAREIKDLNDNITSLKNQLAQQKTTMERQMDNEREKLEKEMKTLKEQHTKDLEAAKKGGQDWMEDVISKASVDKFISSLKEQHRAELEATRKAETQRMKEAYRDLQDKLEEERRQIERMSTAPGSDPQGLEKENRELKEKIRLQRDEHEKEMQKMNRKYTAAGPEREHLEKENREMREDIRLLKAKLAQQQEREMALETEREKLVLDVRCLQDEMEVLKSKHEEQMREMHKKYNANGSDTQDLEKENGDLKENIRSLKEQLKAKLEATKNDVTALQESYKDQIQDMNKRRNHAEKEKQAAMKEMKKLEEECEEIKRNYSGREAVIQRLQVENSQLKQQEQHRAALGATKKAEAERLKEAYGDLQAKLAQQQERELALETEREKLVLDVKCLQDDMEALKGNHAKQLQEMKRKNNANGAETQEMEKENGDLKEKIRSLQEQHKAELAAAKVDADKIKDYINRMKGNHEKQLQEMQRKNNANGAETQEMEKENGDLKEFIRSLQIYYETYSQKMKIDLDQMAKEKQEAVMKMETLQDSYREMQKTYSESKREIHRLQRENSQLKQQILQAAFPGIPPQAAGGTAIPGFQLAAVQDIRGQQTATNPQSKQQAGGAGPKQRQTTIGPRGIYPSTKI
ncbi:uveal autoantigen with coiled-coil domains and ankyrin repeats isoform X3 [Penaeus vannamei]|uniref:uveal autoantigen with coiled-coil domains and ankyrin repeats isoform X3 n=1 Tax=Penaeus vannamei TaxID=6689 RepID=UPI00387FA018